MYEEIHYQENPFSSSPRLANIIPSSHPELLELCESLGEGHKVQTVTCAHCGTLKHYITNCGSRLCEYCRMKSVNRTLSRKGIGKRKMTGLKFLTLTVKSVDSLSNKNTLAIRDYFRKLIRRQFWKKAVRGGIYAIEVTQTNNGFHYHIHAIYEGNFMHWAIIRAHWAKITGGSYIIHVTRAQNARGAMDYLAKYISKIEKGNIKKEQYEAAFKGVKLLQYFGSWYKLEKIESKPICKKCGKSDWIGEWFINSSKSNSYFHKAAWELMRKASEVANEQLNLLYNLLRPGRAL